MTILDKTNLLNSVTKERNKLLEDYTSVDSHYRELYGHHDEDKYHEEMEFYKFLISKWDEYKFNMEKKHLNLN